MWLLPQVALPPSTCLRSGYVTDRMHGWIYGDFTHQREQKDSGVLLLFLADLLFTNGGA